MRLTKRHLISGIVVLLLALTACSSARNDLAGSQWRLTELNGNAPLASTEPISLNFESATQAGGNSGCNIYGGSYRVSGSSLSFSELASTMRACADPAPMEQEGIFLQALGAATTYELANNQLLLKDAAGTVILRFARQ